MVGRTGYSVARRIAVACFVLVFGALSLGGCALLQGGQSAERLNKGTDLPEGAVLIHASYQASLGGATQGDHVYLQLNTRSGYEAADKAAVLRWLLQLAWSVNDHRPSSVNVQMVYLPNTNFQWDDGAAFTALGLDADEVVVRGFPPPRVRVSASEMERLFGPWPGSVPRTPAGLFRTAP